MLPPITPSQHTIIATLLYRFRFLTRIHIQHFINHKHPGTLNKWLTDLTEKNYVRRQYSTALGENTKPAVYSIGRNGIRLMKTSAPAQERYRRNLYYDQTCSATFRTHCLTLADCICNLLSHARLQQQHITLLTKADVAAAIASPGYALFQQVRPDALYVYTGTGIAPAGFIEVIDPLTPSFALRRKIHTYFAAIREQEWQALTPHASFPSVLFLLPSEEKLQSLTRVIQRVRREIDDPAVSQLLRCNLTLTEMVQTQSIASPIWYSA